MLIDSVILYEIVKNSKIICATDTIYVYYAQIYKMKHTVYGYFKIGGKKKDIVRIVTGMGQSSWYCESIYHFYRRNFITPLRAVGLLFSPMVSGWAGGSWKKFVWAVSQKP